MFRIKLQLIPFRRSISRTSETVTHHAQLLRPSPAADSVEEGHVAFQSSPVRTEDRYKLTALL